MDTLGTPSITVSNDAAPDQLSGGERKPTGYRKSEEQQLSEWNMMVQTIEIHAPTPEIKKAAAHLLYLLVGHYRAKYTF